MRQIKSHPAPYCNPVANASLLRTYFLYARIVNVLERKTTISNHVLRQLEDSHHPLSVSQIMDRLAKHNMNPNKTTIYRILDKLITKGAVTEISVRNGATFYEFSHQHHHHFICNECETVFCLDACHVHSHGINLTELLPNKKFKIQSHDFNLYGVCEPCSS